MKRELNESSRRELLKLLAEASKNPKLLDAILVDLLTPAEYREVATRWQIVKRLAAGESHRQIAGDLKIGIATVNRGARMLLNTQGGFNQLLDKKAPRS
jgi:Trp operon repressor